MIGKVNGCSSSDCTMVTIEEKNTNDAGLRTVSETDQFWGERYVWKIPHHWKSFCKRISFNLKNTSIWILLINFPGLINITPVFTTKTIETQGTGMEIITLII